MSWIPLGNAGVFGSPSADFPDQDVEITTPVPAGSFGILTVASHQSGLASGATNQHTAVVDTKGHEWIKIREHSRGLADFDGQVLSVWKALLTLGLEVTDLLTVSFSAETFAQNVAISLEAVDTGGDPVTVVGSASQDGNDTDPNVELAVAAAEPLVWLARGAHRLDEDVITLDPNFTTDRLQISPAEDEGFPNVTTVWGQYREANAASEAWECVLSTARMWNAILIALRVGAGSPGPAPAAVPREFQADFETLTHGVQGASVSRRPDAVSFNYLTAHTIGPNAIGEIWAEDGIARRWRLQIALDPENPFSQQALLSRANAGNTAWEAAEVLFSIGAPFAVECSLCFDEAGRPVVAYERPSGEAGAPEWWLRWFDELNGTPPGSDPDYVIHHNAGRTPRVVLDFFPYVGAHCPPLCDVQLAYVKPGGGIKSRDGREQFLIEHDTAITDDTGLSLERFAAMPLQRVLRLWYSERSAATGRYIRPLLPGSDFPYIDTEPYQNNLLERPSFSPGTEFDLTWFYGEPWREPAASTDTDDFSLQISVTENVDDLELQCANSIPSGMQPDTGGIWTVQNQNRGSPLAAGGAHSFNVSVFHGNGFMQPNVFRARTKRLVSGVPCYSPWRYWFSAIEGTHEEVITSITPVNCGNDVVVCFPSNGLYIYQHNHLANPPNFCEAEAQVSGADCGEQGFFAGGWQPFPPLWRHDWSVQIRSVQAVGFIDPDGVHAFTLLGRVFNSASEGAGMPLPNPNQSPGQWPP
jgi:hypothetical protein